jgi:tetratricopeptide (TPR) repeat protein
MIIRALLITLAMAPVLAIAQNSTDIVFTAKSSEALDPFLRGLEMYENVRVSEARAYFDKALAADPEFAMAFFYQANSSPNAADFQKFLGLAVKYADKVSPAERLVILSAKAQNDGDNVKAGEYLIQAVDKHPQGERLRFMLGNYYFGQQDYDAAEAEYRKSIASNPGYAAPYNILAYLLSNQDRYEEAIDALKKYAELRPADPNPRDSMGEIYLYMGDHQNSMAAYNASLSIDADFVASYAGLGHNHVFAGEFEAARTQYEQLKLHAASVADTNTSFFWTATSYCHEKKYVQAIGALEAQLMFVQRHKDSFLEAVILGQIAEIYREIDKGAEALKYAARERQVATRPEINQAARDNFLRDATFQEAVAFARMGMADSAAARLAEFRASAEATKNPVVTGNLNAAEGIVAFYLKDYPKAIEKLAKANKLDPIAIYYAAMAKEAAGKTEEAEAAFKKLASFNRNTLSYGLVRPWASAKVKHS